MDSLAMPYAFPPGGSLGMPGSGFASRGKGAHIQNLSLPLSVGDGQSARHGEQSTPRTSRSHLLAGLRTAPKSPGVPGVPPSAPPTQGHHPRWTNTTGGGPGVPQTATGAGFPQASTGFPQTTTGFPAHAARHLYSLPEQVLAPPDLGLAADPDDADPHLYAELMATNLYLAQQQQRLQQQLIHVQAAAQYHQMNEYQVQPMNEYGQPPMKEYHAQPMNEYHAQTMPDHAPVITPVPGQPGLFAVYNPLTGQQTYVMERSNPTSPAEGVDSYAFGPGSRRSQAHPQIPQAHPQVSQALPQVSPPLRPGQGQASSPSPPPTSGSAFRRGHAQTGSTMDAKYVAGPRSAGVPATPASGTFGPGQSRAGDHPRRQPRGPPPLDDLLAAPTARHEGSRNFVARQRRRAVHDLVRAGERREPRSGPRSGSSSLPYSSGSGSSSHPYPSRSGSGSPSDPSGPSSAGSTPASEETTYFSPPACPPGYSPPPPSSTRGYSPPGCSPGSGSDSESLGSASLSGNPSVGSLRAARAIGSERKARGPGGCSMAGQAQGHAPHAHSTAGQAHGHAQGGTQAQPGQTPPDRPRPASAPRTPLLVLTADKRRA